jgi:CRISPR-associated protein Cas1
MQLYINTPGCELAIRDRQLVITPPDGEVQVYPLTVVETLFLTRKCQLTTEVLFSAMEHDWDVQFVDRRGSPKARLWSNRFGSISLIRKNQAQFSRSTAAFSWVQQLLQEKCAQQAATLLSLQTDEAQQFLADTVGKMDQMAQRLAALPVAPLVEAASQLRGLEAAASKLYFQTLSKLLPPAYQFGARTRQPALDMFNCLLNYAYGMLYGTVETALIRAGIDPFVGIFHRDEYNRPVLVYDQIERYRHWADYVVSRLCQQEVIFLEFFDVENEAFWLNAYGKRILIQAMTDYLEEVVSLQGLQRSRLTHIEIAAQQLATLFKSYKDQ